MAESSPAARALKRAEATSKVRETVTALQAAGPRTTPAEHLPVDSIVIPEDRLREADPARVEAMARAFELKGQLQPIRVTADSPPELVIGLHRLLAARKLGWPTIWSSIAPAGASRADLRLEEIFENLIRAELTALERAIYLAELKVIHEELHPEVVRRGGGDRKSEAAVNKRRNQNAIFAFSIGAAEKTGLSRRAVELAVSIAKGLGADVRARLQGTWLADHQAGLKALSEQPEATQHQVLDLLFSTPPGAGSVADALVLAAGGRLSTTAEARFRSVADNLARLAVRDRHQLYALHEPEILAWAAQRTRKREIGGGRLDDA